MSCIRHDTNTIHKVDFCVTRKYTRIKDFCQDWRDAAESFSTAIPRKVRFPVANSEETKIAAFVDFENVATSADKRFGDFDLGLLLNAIKARGRITIRRAYGDWARHLRYRDAMREQAVELVHLYSYSPVKGGKNRADIRLAIDALEVVFTQKYVDAVAIVSGDSDFSSLMTKVREYGKYTIGAGVRATTSELLVKSCDEFIFYDDLIEQRNYLAPRQLLETALQNLARAGWPTQATKLKSQMLRIDPSFDEGAIGYDRFREFLEEHNDLVRMSFAGTIIMVEPVRPAPPPPGAGQLKSETAIAVTGVALSGSNTHDSDHDILELAPEPGAVIPRHLVAVPAPEPQAAPVPKTARLRTNSDSTPLRNYLTRITLRPLAPDLRRGVLGDIISASPSDKTLNDLIDELKTRYDLANIMRTRNDVRDVAKLVYRSGILDFGAERPSLAARVSSVVETETILAARKTEQTYLRKLLESGFTVTPASVAGTLFASEESESYYDELLKEFVDLNIAITAGDGYRSAIADPAGLALSDDAMAIVRGDLEKLPLEKSVLINRQAVDNLFEEAARERGRNFIKSAEIGLRAIKVMVELMRHGEPGNGSDELMWQVAVYCSARAGQRFRDREFGDARQYYLAFFSLVQDGELAWERGVRQLLPPMLSFYWATLTHEFDIKLAHFSGHMPPDETLINLTGEMLETGQEKKIRDLAMDLARVNAAQVRSLIEQVEQEGTEPHISMAADLLREALQEPGSEKRSSD